MCLPGVNRGSCTELFQWFLPLYLQCLALCCSQRETVWNASLSCPGSTWLSTLPSWFGSVELAPQPQSLLAVAGCFRQPYCHLCICLCLPSGCLWSSNAPVSLPLRNIIRWQSFNKKIMFVYQPVLIHFKILTPSRTILVHTSWISALPGHRN